MMPQPLLYLGEPDHFDVESAAKLYVRYQQEGGLTADGEHMFLRMCADYQAVLKRAEELKSEPSPAPPAE